MISETIGETHEVEVSRAVLGLVHRPRRPRFEQRLPRLHDLERRIEQYAQVEKQDAKDLDNVPVGARAESLGQVARVGERGRAGVTDLSRSASSVRMTTNRDPNTKMAR